MDHNAAPYEQSRLYVTGCLDVDMVIESGAEPQFLTIYVKEGDADMISWVENITRIIVFERTRGVTECVQNIFAEALRINVIKGNTAEDIFSYMSAEEMTNTALINIGIGNRVQDAHNSRQRYNFLFSGRLRECIHVMQGLTR